MHRPPIGTSIFATIAPGPGLPSPRPSNEACHALRAAGLRSTTSRIAVLQHVSTAGRPVSHADIADRLVPQGFDKSTLHWCHVELADAGILSRLDASDHAWHFELRDERHTPADHAYFVCIDCG